MFENPATSYIGHSVSSSEQNQLNDHKMQTTPQSTPLARRIALGGVILCVVLGAVGGIFAFIQRESTLDIYTRGRPEVAAERLKTWSPIFFRPTHWNWLTAEAYRKQNDLGRVKRIVDELTASDMPGKKANAPLWLVEATSGSPLNVIENLGPLLVLYREHSSEVYSSLLQGLVLKGDTMRVQQILKLWEDQEDDNAELFYWRGVVAASNYELNRAASSFRSALELKPDYHIARLELAQVLLEQAQHNDAKVEFEILVNAMPDDNDVITGYARSLLNLGYADEAARELAKLKNTEQLGSAELALISETNLEAGNADAALAQAKILLSRWPNVGSYHELMARCYAKLNQKQLSEEAFEKAKLSQAKRPEIDQLIQQLDSSPNNNDVRRQLGEIMMTYQDPASGSGYLQVAARANPGDARIHQLLALYLKRENRLKQADVHERIFKQLTDSVAPMTSSQPLPPSQP